MAFEWGSAFTSKTLLFLFFYQFKLRDVSIHDLHSKNLHKKLERLKPTRIFDLKKVVVQLPERSGRSALKTHFQWKWVLCFWEAKTLGKIGESLKQTILRRGYLYRYLLPYCTDTKNDHTDLWNQKTTLRLWASRMDKYIFTTLISKKNLDDDDGNSHSSAALTVWFSDSSKVGSWVQKILWAQKIFWAN